MDTCAIKEVPSFLLQDDSYSLVSFCPAGKAAGGGEKVPGWILLSVFLTRVIKKWIF
jgi:hypothetical protein